MDEYMGTVSLKNINISLKSAEFSIVIGKCYGKRRWPICHERNDQNRITRNGA